MDAIQKLNENYQALTRKQREIVDYLLSNPEDICYISLKDLSRRTNVSEVTILRMCKKLGFENYINMKNAFRRHTQKLVKNLSETSYFTPDLPISEQGDKIGLLRQICDFEQTRSAEFLNSLNPDDVFKAARLILNSRTVLICSHGTSNVVADFFYRRLTPLGINVVLIRPDDMDDVQTNLAKLNPGDHVIVLSFPRYFPLIKNIAQYAEKKGASVTAITDSASSPAVTTNSLNFICKTSTKMFYNSLTLPIALVNLIASGVVLEMGPAYDRLVAEAHEIIDFIKDQGAEE